MIVEHSANQNPNAEQEAMQIIALAGLYRGGFFQHAAFYGGTCLRIFHGLGRFSEDMDFSLTTKNNSVHIENFFDSVKEEFRLAGKDVEIVKKDKKTFGRVESAFLKENTEVYDIKFQTKKSIKIKIELDTDPPLDFNTEEQLLLRPYSFMVRCFTLPCLYAGKMHALVFRNWKHRVKGRDWYDFEWYVRHNIPLDFRHLQARIREFDGRNMDKDDFLKLLKEKLTTTDINSVKQDVAAFVFNPAELEIWSNDYFVKLAEKIVWG
jgi:predicted nucleotidyltransferase component of viral defense system